MTVLANEQVIQGLCERCDSAVEQRNIAQWFFKITNYAQQLLDNLEHIDWSDSTKKAQHNWIGRSEGATLRFPVIAGEHGARPDPASPDTVTDASGELVEVFTTRPDTVFGATFMVLSPEHPLVKSVTSAAQKKAVTDYQDQAAKTDLVSRQNVDKEKSGVFTGGYCRNPATGEAIPVWIADYVLMEYGTGAIMAVPAHDERDFEFAGQMGIEIRRVIAGPGEDAATPLKEAYIGDGTLVNSAAFDGMAMAEGKRAITEWLAERSLGEFKINYRLRDWCISRQRYWGPPIPIVHCDDCGAVPVPEADLPVTLPRIEDFKPDDSGISPLARVESWYQTDCPSCGKPARRETDVSDTFLDSSWYFLRYPSADRTDEPMDSQLPSSGCP